MKYSKVAIAIATMIGSVSTVALAADSSVYKKFGDTPYVSSENFSGTSVRAEDGASIVLNGEEIQISGKGYAAQSYSSYAKVDDSTLPVTVVKLGGEKTKTVSIFTEASSASYAVFVQRWDKGVATAPSMDVQAESISIVAQGGADDDVRAIHVGGNSTNQPETNVPKLSIVGDSITISASAPKGTAISVMSQGQVYINGNVEISGYRGILTRGGTVISINEDGLHSTQLNGDIDFNYDKDTSGTSVDANVLVNFTGSGSVWNGSPKVTWSTGKPAAASTLEVNSLNLAFNDGATWNPVVIENQANQQEIGQFGLAVNTLEVNNANINLSSADQVVAAKTVKGTGATITVPVSVSGDSATVGQFAYEVAEGTPEFQVNLTGITADEMTDNIRNDLAKAVVNGTVDYTAEGYDALVSSEAQIADQKQSVGEGSVAGKQTWSVTNGQVDEASVVEERNTVNDSIIDIASANYLAFRSQMNDVSARMGDLRTMSRVAGAWVRYFGGENKYSGRDMKEKYNTIQLGADGFIGDNFYLGGTLSYTDGEGTLQNGFTDDKNYNFGIYGGWLGDNGQFVDVVVKRHRLETDFDLYSANALSDGSLDTWGTSLSVEAGWRFNCPNTGFYAEPQVEFQLGRVESVNFRTSQGVRVEQDGINSIIGRAGVAVGYVLPENKGALYAKASVLHDWDGEVESSFSRDGVNRTYTDDLGGTWGEFAVGGTYNPTENISAYGQVKTSTGSPVRNPWQFSVGVRYNF